MVERKRTQRGKKREKKNVPTGHAHIQSTFNNTIVTIVLLNVDWMCACPDGTFFFSRFLPRWVRLRSTI